LAAALSDRISPYSVWTSKQKEFIVPGSSGKEKFVVHNDEGAYTGSNTLTAATAYSDNSIFAEVGLRVGTHRIAELAHRMGITTPISTNPAMTIGGLKVGVTPLDMAHAYETIAHGGQRISGTLAEAGAPVGIQEVASPGRPLPDGSYRDINAVTAKRVLSPEIAATETEMLETVLQYGTAKAAALGEFAAGKTGTTSNYVDAWFVGWNHKYTVAVWVGYPEGAKPMLTDFNGGPVLGGTYPALIWHDFMISALHLDKARAEEAAAKAAERASGRTGKVSSSSSTSSSEETAPSAGSPGAGAQGEERAGERRSTPNPGGGAGAGTQEGAGERAGLSEHAPAGEHPATPTPANPVPAAPPTPAPAPAESAPAPKTGGGGTGGGGASSEATGGVSASP
ncbi:MAG TPA: penicillin-binding transpeptidase domain-containing protein, partial [Solirubrobacteraceae bacterium]|nr:penicillin-binding transpeptidase domain-containing protein [Solirubrobacteraceae bacterium]